MPDFPIIDTHLHVWDPAQLAYPWLADLPAINKPHVLSDYNEHTAGVTVEQMVFLQCECDPAQYQQEAAWVSSLAAEDPRITGMVPWAPLEKGAAARDELAALVEANPLTKGIRRIVQFEDDPRFCLQPDFIAGVQLLADFNLSFDICTKGDAQMRSVIDLVRRCPDVKFVLDHIGKPMIDRREIQPWAGSLRDLAAMPNTWCKISGVINEAGDSPWTPADLHPYIHHAIDAFGTGRVMFGGDWPVLTLAATYADWITVFDEAISDLSPGDKVKLYHDNAVAFYRLR